jgi:hypothetical protein
MNAGNDDRNQSATAAFERDARAALERSTERLSGRVQSRLTQARHQALEEFAARERQPAWRRWFGAGGRGSGAAFGLMPAGAAAAVTVLGVMLWVSRPDPAGFTRGENLGARGEAAAAFEDIEFLADSEALDLASESDPEFVEWAVLSAGSDGAEVIGT